MNTREQNEANLTAYALDELDEAERAEVERRLASEPDAQEQVEQIRAMATRLREDLQLEQAVPCGQGLDASRVYRVITQPEVRSRRRLVRVAIGLAACLVVGVIAVNAMLPSLNRARQYSLS